MQSRLFSTIRFVAVSALIVALGALAGWYYYLHAKGGAAAQIDAARGTNAPVPSFSGASGSTYKNIITDTVSRIVDMVQGGQKDTAIGRLWHAERTPVAGAGFVTLGTTTVLRYAQQGTGYLFTGDLSARTTERLSNVLLPKTYAAQFATDGSFVLQVQSDDGTMRTIAGDSLPAATTTTASTTPIGRELPPNLRSIALDPVHRTLFWIAPDPKGGVVGASVPWKSTTGTKVFSSGIMSWRPYATTDGRLYVALAPADGVDGFAYEVQKDGTLTPLVRKVPGLSILPSGNTGTLLYSAAGGGIVSLYAKTAASSTPLLLPLHTIADKCVWLPGASLIAYCAVPKDAPGKNFLTDWYQGATHSSDAWWEIDVQAGTTRQLYSPEDSDSLSLDVVHPTIDPSGNYIAFTDGNDQSLWVFRVH